VGQVGWRVGLPSFSPADGADANTEVLGDESQCMVFAGFVQIGKYGVLIADQSKDGIHVLPLGIFADSMSLFITSQDFVSMCPSAVLSAGYIFVL